MQEKQASKLFKQWQVLDKEWQRLDNISFEYSNSDTYKLLECNSLGMTLNDNTRHDLGDKQFDIEELQNDLEDKINALGYTLEFMALPSNTWGYALALAL